MELLNKLGIHPALLVAQIINFLILLFVLHKFLYNPVLKIMKKREDKIAKSIDSAEKIDKKLKDMEAKYDAKIVKAKKDAIKILEGAEKQAVLQREESIVKTKKDVADIIKKAKDQIALQKEKMIEDVKSEVGGLVVSAVEKIIDKESMVGVDKKTIDSAIKKIS